MTTEEQFYETLRQSYQKDLEKFQEIESKHPYRVRCYVYALVDPRGGKDQVFYVGKGTGLRMFDHVLEVIEKEKSGKLNKLSNEDFGEKIDRIHDIHKDGQNVKMYILHFGLTNEHALILESALIDIFSRLPNVDQESIADLVNQKRGYDCENGFSTIASLARALNTKGEIDVKEGESVLVIKINEVSDDDDKILDRVSKYWRVNVKRANKVTYVAACNNGVIVGLYEKTSGWHKITDPKSPHYGRCEFRGKAVKAPEVEERYLYHTVPTKKNAQNPIKYFEDVQNKK